MPCDHDGNFRRVQLSRRMSRVSVSSALGNRIRRVRQVEEHANQCRTDRGVLGQRGGRVVLRDPEEPDVLPADVRHPKEGGFAVAEYIEVFYSWQHLHSTLGHRTPQKLSPSIETQQQLPQTAESLSKNLYTL